MAAIGVFIRDKGASLFELTKIRRASPNVFGCFADVEKISHIPTN